MRLDEAKPRDTRCPFRSARHLLPLFLAILALALGRLVSHAGAQQIPAQEITDEAIRGLKLKLVDRINIDRRAAGVPPVAFLDELSIPADEHCREMLAFDYTSHWNRTGLKPYMRYSLAGITDHTSENIASLFDTRFDPTLSQLEKETANRHDSFMSEKPPADLHRKAVLDPRHTHVGIGMAFGRNRLKLIEVFAHRYVRINPLPSRVNLSDKLLLSGKILVEGFEVQGISVFYEPLPEKRPIEILRALRSYGLPDDRQTNRPMLRKPYFYEDGSMGDVQIRGSDFTCPISFYRNKPGVYTIAVWLKGAGGSAAATSSAFMATNICIFVGGSGR